MIPKRLLQLETKLFESLASARKLYSSKIPENVFQELVSLDPSKTFKYIEKICKFYIQNSDLNLEELKQEIETFEELCNKNIIDKKDINQFKTYIEFREFVKENSGRMSRSEERNLIKNEGSEVIFNTPELLVLLIKDEKASIQYGSGTKWCKCERLKELFQVLPRKRSNFLFCVSKESHFK